MNSQQELLDAINTISQKQDRSCDTPATVLRVEDDTVWVHIDGGADETPVRKTINCEQGETVQVRISNGSAFLVGNASAPPTDDKTANVAHFVAEQADIKATDANVKATEAKETVEVLEGEVEGKVDVGTSNIQHLSSTMYQNANGVNIFNDSLAAGDSYAHIDGDEFCIREVTSAGVIDDTNDEVVASFGKTDSLSQSYVDHGTYVDRNYLQFSANNIRLGSEEVDLPLSDAGWEITGNKIEAYSNYANAMSLDATNGKINIYQNSGYVANEPETEVGIGYIKMTGEVWDFNGRQKTPTILFGPVLSPSDTSCSIESEVIEPESTIDIYDTIFGFAPTSVTVTQSPNDVDKCICTITFPAQSVSHQIKLHVYNYVI